MSWIVRNRQRLCQQSQTFGSFH